MTTSTNVERILEAFLAPSGDRLNADVLETVLDQIDRTPQTRRMFPVSWRFPVNYLGRASLAVIAVAVALGVVFYVLSPKPSVGPVTPTASQSPVVSPTGTVRPTPSSSVPALLAPMGYPGAGTIEYTNHDASGKDVLWLVDPSGANPTILVNGGCCGVFSPDGHHRAVAAAGAAASGLTRDPSLLGIEVLDRPGTHVAFIVPTGCGACAALSLNNEPDAWSPNGQYIALDMWSDTDSTKTGLAIADRDFPLPWDWATSLQGPGGPDIPLAFSPDSTHLLFMQSEQTDGLTDTGPVYVLNVSDLSARQISPPGIDVSANGLTQGPASYSPDGQTIAFAGTDALGKTSIYTIGQSVGSTLHTVVANTPGATSARFSPDGTLIAFDQASGRQFHDLFVVRPDGSGLTNLTTSFAPGVCCAQWSPDGRAMLVAGTSSDDAHNNLYVVAADASGIWQVTNDPNVYSGFLWGPAFR
jgi:hypothetical protein